MATNAWPTYFGNVRIETLNRISLPTSPIMLPSRAKMIDACGGVMICHASVDWAETATSGATRKKRTRRIS